jgi:hypothetical protein
MLAKASNLTRYQVGFLSQARSVQGSLSSRYFAAPTQELLGNLKSLGIRNTNVVHNPS